MLNLNILIGRELYHQISKMLREEVLITNTPRTAFIVMSKIVADNGLADSLKEQMIGELKNTPWDTSITGKNLINNYPSALYLNMKYYRFKYSSHINHPTIMMAGQNLYSINIPYKYDMSDEEFYQHFVEGILMACDGKYPEAGSWKFLLEGLPKEVLRRLELISQPIIDKPINIPYISMISDIREKYVQ